MKTYNFELERQDGPQFKIESKRRPENAKANESNERN